MDFGIFIILNIQVSENLGGLDVENTCRNLEEISPF